MLLSEVSIQGAWDFSHTRELSYPSRPLSITNHRASRCEAG